MPVIDVSHQLLAILCGSLVGASLALIGGGGSILAVPLLLYVVGVRDAHLAIGTSTLAVSLNAFANLVPHARAGHVRWREAAVFAVAGVLGAAIGSGLGKWLDGQRLLVLFAALMLVVAALMWRPRTADAVPRAHPLPWLGGTGLCAGGLAGFFGIGGGFLIVPGLMFAGGFSVIEAVGSALLAVGLFGATTAASYAASGLIDWRVAAEFVAGGLAGGWLGALGAHRLARRRGALNRLLTVMIAAVAVYMLWREAGRL
ncbi:sulfite exporter TauE/SafE family protein [Fulvimonas sp. R45]|uniref:sulfite exporter TauE/SafE family protein n=1 Tax=Fulvimonas sp. R45 TaxID=3045937 RepID=UPI00265F7600|nr:sulfite exporter TauE/SafE family protein [Fulvimonas sp. R45]MDO1528882.1 sulfite exporter TauE/SafE family protein [Fulvimonas sp. R45]